MWLETFLTIYTIRSFSILWKVYIIRYNYEFRSRYELYRILTIDLIMVIWLIYGNELYFSDENDCEKKESTEPLAEIMGVIIFLGYIPLFFYLILLVTLPCLLWYLHTVNS